MKFKIQIVIESDEQTPPLIQEIAQIERNHLKPENLGLSLSEAKAILKKTQQSLVEQQVSEYEKQHSLCQDCGSKLLHKDKGDIHL